jgi:hypothetical protein
LDSWIPMAVSRLLDFLADFGFNKLLYICVYICAHIYTYTWIDRKTETEVKRYFLRKWLICAIYIFLNLGWGYNPIKLS